MSETPAGYIIHMDLRRVHTLQDEQEAHAATRAQLAHMRERAEQTAEENLTRAQKHANNLSFLAARLCQDMGLVVRETNASSDQQQQDAGMLKQHVKNLRQELDQLSQAIVTWDTAKWCAQEDGQ